MVLADFRGQSSIGLSNAIPFEGEPTLPPISEATPPDEIIAHLVEQLSNLEVLVEGKVNKDEIKSEIAFGDEGVKIQAEEIVLFGNVTLGAYVDDHRGQGDGSLDISITRIIGDRIQTGIITSNNWGASEGTAIDLDNSTITMGGSSSPSLYYDGAGNLSITGALNAGSTISTTATVNGTNMGDIESHVGDTGNPHNTSLDTITGDLDDIDDGSTYFRSTANQNTGGTRGYNALDSSYDYIRTLSTTKIIVSGSNPTNGVVLDSAGLRMYDGGAIQIDLPSNGDPATFSGDIVTAGKVHATDANSLSGINAAIRGGDVFGAFDIGVQGGSSQFRGVIGTTATGIGVEGNANSTGGTGGEFSTTSASGYGLQVYNSGTGGKALYVSEGDVDINDDLNVDGNTQIDGTLDVDSAATFSANVTITGNSDLTIDRSLFVASDDASGDSSIVIGSSSGATGNNTCVFKEGAAGAQTAGEMHLYGHALSGETCLGIVSELDVDSGSYSPTVNRLYKVVINGDTYNWYLEAA